MFNPLRLETLKVGAIMLVSITFEQQRLRLPTNQCVIFNH